MEPDIAHYHPESFRQILGKALRNRSFLIGAGVSGLILGMAVLSFIWTPF